MTVPFFNDTPINGATPANQVSLIPSGGQLAVLDTYLERHDIFSSFQVTVAGNVVILGINNTYYYRPACQPGVIYYGLGIQIASAGTVGGSPVTTTATGIYVYTGT